MVNLPPEVSSGASDYFYFSHLVMLRRPLALTRIFFSVPLQSAAADDVGCIGLIVGFGSGGPAVKNMGVHIRA